MKKEQSRGQPGNAGQFGPGGYAKKEKPAPKQKGAAQGGAEKKAKTKAKVKKGDKLLYTHKDGNVFEVTYLGAGLFDDDVKISYNGVETFVPKKALKLAGKALPDDPSLASGGKVRTSKFERSDAAPERPVAKSVRPDTPDPDEGYWQRLEQDDLDAVDDYTKDSSAINDCVRKAKCSGDSRKLSKRLTGMIDKHPKADPPRTVYRGLKGDHIPQFLEGAKPGSTLTMKGFQSTSVSQKSARKFAASKDSDGVLLEITTRRGLPLGKKSHFPDEKEVLLGDSWRYRVLSVTKGKPPRMKLEVVDG